MSIELIINSFVSGVISGINFALFALGLSFIFGILKVINLSHGELVLLGAYIGYWGMNKGNMPFSLTIPSAFICTGLLGLFYSSLIRRVRDNELNTLILTYGVGVILTNLFLILWTADERIINIPWMNEGLRLWILEISRGNIITAICSGLIILLLFLFLNYTKMGKSIRATASDRESAALVGINVDLMDRISFAIGCAMAGIAGPLFGIVSHINPVSGELIAINGFILTVLAGVGSIPGLIVAGMILGVGEALTVVFYSSMYQGVFAFLVFIFIMFFKPSGLFGRGR